MKRQKINCSGNRSRRKFRGKKTLFLNLGKEVISVYQRNDHPQKTSSYPINTSSIYTDPLLSPTEAGNAMMAGLWKMLSQGSSIPQSSCCCQNAPDTAGHISHSPSRGTSAGLTPWQRLWLSQISTCGQELAGSFWLKNCSLEKHQFPEKFCGK